MASKRQQHNEWREEYDQDILHMPWEHRVIAELMQLIAEGEPLPHERAILQKIAIRRFNAAQLRNYRDYRHIRGNIDPYDMAILVLKPKSTLARRMKYSFNIDEWE